MIATMFLAVVFGGKPLCAPPINPRFSVRFVKQCKCTDTGAACVCVNGECRCTDCPTRSPSTPIPASIAGTVGRVATCSNGSCQPQATAVRSFDEPVQYSSPCANGQCGRSSRRGWFRR